MEFLRDPYSKTYTVPAAQSPKEAIQTAQGYGGEIRLLITDVVMPEMNGQVLAKDLLALYPGIQCLFMSGYTADIIAHHGLVKEGMHFIQKPFSIEEINARIQEVFDDRVPSSSPPFESFEGRPSCLD